MATLRDLHTQLAVQYAAKLQLGDTPLPELRDLQERMHLLDAAMADPNRAVRSSRRATWLAIFSVAVVLSLAALIPMPSVPFSLEAEASSLRLQLPSAGELGPQMVSGDLQVNGFTSLESPDAALMQAGAKSGGRMSISATPLNLRRLSYPGATTIDLVAGAQAASLTLQSQHAPIGIELELTGRTTTRMGHSAERREVDFPYSEWIKMRAGDATAPDLAPPTMVISLAHGSQTEYLWSDLQPTELRFVERGLKTGNEPTILSSLQKARIQFQASGTELVLGAGDELDLAGLQLQRCDVVLGQVVRVRLSGTARSLLTRTGGFERSLKPSLLEHATRHKRVELFWTAALFLWGVTRWLQRLASTNA